MKKTRLILFLAPFLFIGFIACGGEEEGEAIEENDYEVDKDQFLKDLSELEVKLEADLVAPEEDVMREAVTMFQDYAEIFPEDPKSPDYLLRASDLSLALNLPEKSVKILDRIINEFPDYSRMEDVMYNKASHLDFEMRDTSRAKTAYKDFIAAYPNSELVDDAESRIVNIRYSLEELAEKFINDLENGNAPEPEGREYIQNP